jgi:hypothetical protein
MTKVDGKLQAEIVEDEGGKRILPNRVLLSFRGRIKRQTVIS